MVGPTSRLAICAAGLLLLPGCSIFAAKSQCLTIQTSDPAARIYVDDQEVGVGEAVVMVRRDAPHTVVARLGERGASAFVGLECSTTAWIDIAFACPTLGISAIFGNMAAGFWVLERDRVRLEIPRQ